MMGTIIHKSTQNRPMRRVDFRSRQGNKTARLTKALRDYFGLIASF
ncbi:hypothetical protein [Psychrobacillus psychrotolerans]